MNRRAVLYGMGGLAGAAALGSGWRHATGSLSDYAEYQQRLRAPMAPDIRDVIRYSALAASSHNTQPWRYRITGNSVDILPDITRRTPVVDPDDHHLFVSLGCAAENLHLAAMAAGLGGEFSDEVPGVDGVRYAFGRAKSAEGLLFKAIPLRQSTRGVYDGRTVPTEDIAKLEGAARFDGVGMSVITDLSRRKQIAELVIEANSRQMSDPAFMEELRGWLRFNPSSAMSSGDGLFSAASGNPVVPDVLGRLAFRYVVTAASENDRYGTQMDSSAGFVVFFGDGQDAGHRVKVGRACQRFCLAATAEGLKTAFLNQPLEVPEYRDGLSAITGQLGKRPDILMRFGRGPTLPYSPRRALDTIIT